MTDVYHPCHPILREARIPHQRTSGTAVGSRAAIIGRKIGMVSRIRKFSAVVVAALNNASTNPYQRMLPRVTAIRNVPPDASEGDMRISRTTNVRVRLIGAI